MEIHCAQGLLYFLQKFMSNAPDTCNTKACIRQATHAPVYSYESFHGCDKQHLYGQQRPCRENEIKAQINVSEWKCPELLAMLCCDCTWRYRQKANESDTE